MNEAIAEYVAQRFCEMERDGFSIVKKIPSSGAKRFLLGYEALSVDERRLFRTAISERAAMMWWGDTYDPHASNPAAQLFFRFICSLPYPPWIHDSPAPLARAPELRRVAKLAFGQLFGTHPEKDREPGDWHYSGRLLGEDVSVKIRYSTRLGQIVYGLKLEGVAGYYSFSFEQLYGFGVGGWDLIHVSDVDQAFAVLKELIEITVADYKRASALRHKKA